MGVSVALCLRGGERANTHVDCTVCFFLQARCDLVSSDQELEQSEPKTTPKSTEKLEQGKRFIIL